MRRSTLFLFFAVAPLALGLGCGDDGPSDGGVDTGVDTGAPTDTGGNTDSSRDSSPPMDTGADTGIPLPVPECDPFAPACGADEKCALIFWNPDGEMPDDTVLFYGCTSNDSGTKGLDVVCTRFIQLSPGNPDDVYATNDCDEGLFCWNTLEDSFERCRALCGADNAPDCGDETEFCLTINGDPLIALCNPLSDCDPIAQTGCDAAEGCYSIGTTQGDLGARCFDEPTTDDAGVPPAGLGDACMFINSCRPGLSCSRDILADGGAGDTTTCRRYCEELADGGVADGGVPDGGMDAGALAGCMASEACVGLEIPDGGASLLPSPTGLCR